VVRGPQFEKRCVGSCNTMASTCYITIYWTTVVYAVHRWPKCRYAAHCCITSYSTNTPIISTHTLLFHNTKYLTYGYTLPVPSYDSNIAAAPAHRTSQCIASLVFMQHCTDLHSTIITRVTTIIAPFISLRTSSEVRSAISAFHDFTICFLQIIQYLLKSSSSSSPHFYLSFSNVF
jgi:hypothetical protein